MSAVKVLFRYLVFILVVSVTASAHPEFSTGSVVNGASFMPVPLPSGKIARGSIFSVFGTDMGPPLAAVNPSFPLQTEIGGVTITVQSIGDATVHSAIPLYAGSLQVNAIMPSNVPLGPATLIVYYTGGTIRPNSTPVDIVIVESSLGLFTIAGSGTGPAVINNFVAPGNEPLNSLLESAKPGQIVTAWATGLGPIQAPDNMPAPAGSLPVAVEVFVGGKKSPNVAYSGRSPCCSGLDQIVFAVPPDAPTGCYVPLSVRVAGQIVSNSATMSVAEAGGVCSDPLNGLTQSPAFNSSFFKLGAVGLQKTTLTDTGSSQTAVTDQVSGLFGTVRTPRWFFEPTVSLPALGSCISYQFRNRTGGLSAALAPSPALDSGTQLSVAGGAGTAVIPRVFPGIYRVLRGPLNGTSLVLSAGAAAVSGPGGGNIGSFTANAAVSGDPNWNHSSLAVINRTDGVTIQWSGVPAGTNHVRIMGISESSLDASNNVNGVFLCTVPADATSFFVPAETLANMPASATACGALGGAIYVGTSPNQPSPTFEAPGIDIGITDSVSYVGRLVEFR
jgi:uncharacterized protein (TIGR03437 family)